MKIETEHDIDDLVYFFDKKVIRIGKIVRIVTSIDKYCSQKVVFTLLSTKIGTIRYDGSDEEFCEKYDFEVDHNAGKLLNRFKDNVVKEEANV